MKVLFTGCTFSAETLKQLEDKDIYVVNGRMDYTEQELSDKLKEVDCYINGGDEICLLELLKKIDILNLFHLWEQVIKNI